MGWVERVCRLVLNPRVKSEMTKATGFKGIYTRGMNPALEHSFRSNIQVSIKVFNFFFILNRH